MSAWLEVPLAILATLVLVLLVGLILLLGLAFGWLDDSW